MSKIVPELTSELTEETQESSQQKQPLHLEFRYVYIPFISRISTSELVLDLRIDFDILWKASEADKLLYSQNPEEYRPVTFVPSLVFQNSKDVDVVEVPGGNGSPYSIENGKNFVRLKVTGTFLQNFNVTLFPFDHQIMRIVTTISFKTADQVIFCPESNTKNVLYLLTEYNAIKDWQITGCKLQYYVDSSNFAFVETQISISRVPWNITFNYFGTATLITIVGLLSQKIESKSDRMSFLVTVLLTIIALQFSVIDKLPPSPYLTLSDWYLLTNSGFIAALLYQTAISDDNFDEFQKSHSFLNVSMAYVSLEVIFVVICTYSYYNPEWGVVSKMKKASRTFVARWGD